MSNSYQWKGARIVNALSLDLAPVRLHDEAEVDDLLARETADLGIAPRARRRFAYADARMSRVRAAPSMPRLVVSRRKRRKIPHEEVHCNKLDMSNYCRHEIADEQYGRVRKPASRKGTERNGWKTRRQ